MNSLLDIEELVNLCRSQNARTYVKEAVDSYRVGAFRACIISTWIALVYDFIDKLRELEIHGDKAAKSRVAEFERIQKARDTDAALKFERDILGIVQKDFELITVQEASDFGRLQEDRNRFGHPNLNGDAEIHVPSAELARLHLRNVVVHALSQPPLQGKAALASIHAAVDSEYFPTNVTDAETALKATPLKRCKAPVVLEFVRGGLISLIRENISSAKGNQRIAALQATGRLYPEVVTQFWKDQADSIISRATDEQLRRTLRVLSKMPELHAYILEATWLRLDQYVKLLSSTSIWPLTYGLKIERLSARTTSTILSFSATELREVIPKLSVNPGPEVIDRAISLLGESSSFSGANENSKSLIIPLVEYMDAERAKRTLSQAQNGQVGGSSGFSDVLKTILRRSLVTTVDARKLLPKGFEEYLDEIDAGATGEEQ